MCSRIRESGEVDYCWLGAFQAKTSGGGAGVSKQTGWLSGILALAFTLTSICRHS